MIERFAYLSLAKDEKDDYNVPTYYVDRVNNGSDWVRWANHALVDSITTGEVIQKLKVSQLSSPLTIRLQLHKQTQAEENLSVASFGGGSNDQLSQTMT